MQSQNGMAANRVRSLFRWSAEHHNALVAAIALSGVVLHLLGRYAMGLSQPQYNAPLCLALGLGGVPVLVELGANVFRGRFGADWLAGISIVTSVLLEEYLAGVLVVLMLSGGEAIEAYAISSASSVLSALAKRVPSVAHRRQQGQVEDVTLDQICVGDVLAIMPHETCPVDGIVIEGHGAMDESFLTGEPYNVAKAPGAVVLSGALNGDSSLTIEATKRASDSRYAQIMKVMQQAEQFQPNLRRLGDQLGAWYTPLAVTIAGIAWGMSGEPTRFLSVLVVATPCPLLIAIPVAIIASISLSARNGIIIKKPVILEQLGECRTIVFDKTGTLTYGRPTLSEQLVVSGEEPRSVLQLVASLERYSKHPLAHAILEAARQQQVSLVDAARIEETPGRGLTGTVAGREVHITGRAKYLKVAPQNQALLPPPAAGLECIVAIDGAYAATYRFRDEPRSDGKPFISHLGPRHGIDRIMIVSGDRESEVRYLASQVGITDVRFQQSPEQKLDIIREETAKAPTIFVGDGINDAPALQIATVGVAFGHFNDITVAAAGAVILDSSLKRVDVLLHIGRRMRSVALQSALGGMLLSLVGVGFAACGVLPPVAGALLQELIDVVAVLNATRAAWSKRDLVDF